MKFNISLKVLPLLACGMLMASCNDFLKQEPLTDITPTDYYKDATQLQAVANAFYQTVLPYHSGAGYGTFAYVQIIRPVLMAILSIRKVVGRLVTTTLHGAGTIFVISTIS
jgi:hypothetical protein